MPSLADGSIASPVQRGRRAPTGSRRPRRGAFTLVEMLAAVTIIGILCGMAVPRLQDAVQHARVASAIGDLRAIAIDLAAADTLPATLSAIGRGTMLDPWGRPYVYMPFPRTRGGAPPPGARKDRFLVPINSRFDLYSVGRDGKTTAALTARTSKDDVIVANDGGFVGLATRY